MGGQEEGLEEGPPSSRALPACTRVGRPRGGPARAPMPRRHGCSVSGAAAGHSKNRRFIDIGKRKMTAGTDCPETPLIRTLTTALYARDRVLSPGPDLEIECIHTGTGYTLFVFGIHTLEPWDTHVIHANYEKWGWGA